MQFITNLYNFLFMTKFKVGDNVILYSGSLKTTGIIGAINYETYFIFHNETANQGAQPLNVRSTDKGYKYSWATTIESIELENINDYNTRNLCNILE